MLMRKAGNIHDVAVAGVGMSWGIWPGCNWVVQQAHPNHL